MTPSVHSVTIIIVRVFLRVIARSTAKTGTTAIKARRVGEMRLVVLCWDLGES
jgi:hypothetical protein